MRHSSSQSIGSLGWHIARCREGQCRIKDISETLNTRVLRQCVIDTRVDARAGHSPDQITVGCVAYKLTHTCPRHE